MVVSPGSAGKGAVVIWRGRRSQFEAQSERPPTLILKLRGAKLLALKASRTSSGCSPELVMIIVACCAVAQRHLC